MTAKTKKFILVFTLVFLFFFSASFVLAEGTGLPNPLTGNDTPIDPRIIVGNVIKALLGVVGSLALLVFILAGFTWVISAGNEEKIKKGKEMATWAAFGLVVIFFAYALVTFVVNAVTGGSGQTQNPPAAQTQDQIPLYTPWLI